MIDDDDVPDLNPIVAFDFDGTLTVRDSFTAFLAWKAGSVGWIGGLVRLSPALLAYIFHRDRGKLKGRFIRHFLAGQKLESIEASAREFAQIHGQSLLRPDAVAAWRRWRSRGAKIVIVTASPDVIVAPFARGLGADLLIGSKLSVDESGRVRGRLEGPNCRGAEKVRRLTDALGPDLQLAAAYGDTSGDREMLRLAREKGYRVFTGKPA
jgi:phosphatidylglycerophosphatase C